ncbi:MAG: type 4a pilus biogenesis protein PilO [Planctomycetota bacterium]|nr:type 4a pilus biogenesis protein PilO [Planctomycetota bacterium]
MKLGLREIVFTVLLMALPIGAWWFVFRPHNVRNNQMLQQIEAKRNKFKELNQITGTIGNVQKEIDSLSKAIAFFHSKLPNEKEIDKVLKEVWLLAESSQLTTKSIRTLKRKSDRMFLTAADSGSELYAEQPIAMQLQGDFVGFYTFLQALENQPRIMRIRKMTLKKLPKQPEGVMQANFVMSVFFERGDRN